MPAGAVALPGGRQTRERQVKTFVLPESFLERFKYGITANYCDHTIISYAFLHNGMELTAHVMLQKDYVFQLEDTGFMFFYKGQLNLRDLVLGTKPGSPLLITDFDGGDEGVNPLTTADEGATGSNEASADGATAAGEAWQPLADDQTPTAIATPVPICDMCNDTGMTPGSVLPKSCKGRDGCGCPWIHRDCKDKGRCQILDSCCRPCPYITE